MYVLIGYRKNGRGTEMLKIERGDMLELTRRMTVSRNCFSRIAGAYMDEEGFVDGTFHTHFLKLSGADKTKNLALAKEILIAETNNNLRHYRFAKESQKPGSFWQLLMALRECELKNDALLYSAYEHIGEVYQTEHPYSIYFYFGNYDVPRKGADKAEQWESEEVFRYLICTICPVSGDYEVGKPECGFLFPAFSNRSTDCDGINIYQADLQKPHRELEQIIGISNR